MKAQQEALESFLSETLDHITSLERELVFLEQNPEEKERLNTAFRAIHTIKGTCGFLGLPNLESLAHAAEDLLGAIRSGTLTLEQHSMNLLLEVADTVRIFVEKIRETGSDEGVDAEALHDRLRRAYGDGEPGGASDLRPEPDPSAITEAGDSLQAGGETMDQRIQVDVRLLDRLMNLVGELVLTRNRLLHSRGDAGSESGPVFQRLDTVTSELQHGLLQARMQPISSLWSGYPRMLRDLEQETGKQVSLTVEGGETELDRTLLQAIRDPLTHLLRNAVDHGIESPEERRRTGKPERGQLRRRALHGRGNVIVEISDDGAGIDPAGVLRSARDKGLVDEAAEEGIRESEILDLLFRPGFSTRKSVTSLSGRGVGLDVVKSAIRGIDGSIDIRTAPGEGTSFRVTVPLTLSIIPAVILVCDGTPLAVPQSSIREILELGSDSQGRHIEYIHDRPVYRLRGQLLPLVDLRELLALRPRPEDEMAVSIAVIDADGFTCGIVVDSVMDTEEIVVKPLGRHLRNLDCYSGATIMGDGRLALILDARAVAERVQEAPEEQETQAPAQESTQDQSVESDGGEPVLLCSLSDQPRAAIPLEQVARLEELDEGRIERSRGMDVIQYRGEILPLVRLDRSDGENLSARAGTDRLPTVVCRSSGRQYGIVVSEILDIGEMNIHEIEKEDAGAPVAGCSVVNGKVTDLLNLDAILTGRYSGSTGHAGLPVEEAHEQ